MVIRARHLRLKQLAAGLRSRLRRPRLLRRAARSIGFDLVRGSYYSPVADIETLPAELWTDPPPMPGLDLRLESSLEFVKQALGPFIGEYSPPNGPPGTSNGYYLANGLYPEVDGQILYGMVRQFSPRRIVEVGAGFSTLVISDALDANARDGHQAPVRNVFDPFPGPVLASANVYVHMARAQDIDLSVFAALQDGDLLMIDTTHTVKAGGDVVRLVLEVLPTIQAGVIVHIHDFFRPYEYPRSFYTDHWYCWQEHYLVQALLTMNPNFEVIVANHALAKTYPDDVAALIPRMASEAPGSALWLRRTH